MSTLHLKDNKRYITSFIKQDLKDRMVFIGGPRQVGKTTLAQALLKNYHEQHPAYFNWDFLEHQKKIKDRAWPSTEKLIIFDEIHKFKGWKNLVKGYFDILKNSHQFLITGSARLDHFRKGGDSLLGRYHYYRLHPFTLNELGLDQKNIQLLFTNGGFPEPLKKNSPRFLRRWHLERLNRLIRNDLRDLEYVSDIDKIYRLAELLPTKVGSILSTKSLSEDLLIDFKTCKRWLSILDSLYYSFQISPFGSPKIKAVKKEQKLYLWDWSQVEDDGARFENMVASHLLKYCHFLEDTDGHSMELRYIRDTEKREVDFVVIKNKIPLFAVECKLNDTKLSDHIKYFSTRTNIPKFFQIHLGTKHHESFQINDQISILPFMEFCRICQLK